jgi:DNA-binding NtrC family response regulator
LTDNYAQNSNKPGAFAELRDGLERQAILYTLEKCENNVSKATEMMGLQNRSTLYSMMKRLEISPTEQRVAEQRIKV